jgi:hypothetical protein
LDLLRIENTKTWNTNRITTYLRKNNIHNSKDYNNFITQNEHLGLPSVQNLFTNYKDFTWYATYRENECPYYNKKECITNIKKANIYELDLDGDEVIQHLNKIDNKIPNECLFQFYGGVGRDYFT